MKRIAHRRGYPSSTGRRDTLLGVKAVDLQVPFFVLVRVSSFLPVLVPCALSV